MKEIIEQIKKHPRYLRNIEYGAPRAGHPEGSVKAHILELEANLEYLKPRLPNEESYWKLKFLIHVHDSFKAEAIPDSPITSPQSHASLAKAFAEEFTDDADLLNMLQFHDENFALWRQYDKKGSYSQERFQALLDTIQDWDLFAAFLIIDGTTAGKSPGKLKWFLAQVNSHKALKVDESWIPK